MNRQYNVCNSSKSSQKDTDNWILQRSAVRELPAKTLTPQREIAAGDLLAAAPMRDHAKGINLDLMQIPVSNNSAIPVQAKLEIGPANDKYEKEADRVAKQVVQKLHEPQSAQPQKPQTSQGKVNREVEEVLQRKSRLQLKGDEGKMTAAPELESSISRSRGSGQPLSEGIREPMEKAFGGVDFSGVKVHTDGKSDQLNRSIQAKAFTTGQDVFFRQGAYAPGSREGQDLIAHELTHVVQQNGEFVRRSSINLLQRSPHTATERPSAKTIQAKQKITTLQQANEVVQRKNDKEYIGDKARHHMHAGRGVSQPHYKNGNDKGSRISIGSNQEYKKAQLEQVIDTLKPREREPGAAECIQWCKNESKKIIGAAGGRSALSKQK